MVFLSGRKKSNFKIVPTNYHNIMKDWRDDLDPQIESKLEKLLRDLREHEEAYKAPFDKKTAQLWVALAHTYDRIDTVNRRLRRIEKILNKIQEDSDKKDKKIKDEELRKSLQNY